VSDEDRRHIGSLLPAGQRYAVLLPGTNWPTKRWPTEKFAELAGALSDRFNLVNVLAGGADVVPLAPQIVSETDASRQSGLINLAGATNLPQLVALLERADLVVANDSGPMHIAAALNRPLITLFGPTNPVRTGPYNRAESVLRLDIPCSPC